MRRNIEEKFAAWKSKKRRKPLVVYGARQIGKTYSIREFGKKHYAKTVYINFETSPRIARDFEEDISPAFLIPRLEIFLNQKIHPEDTLIFFDEIQVCERALTSLKYFCEEAPQYHVIAAGSLLGVAVNRERYSFPVGKVEPLYMYPMQFDEFLSALSQDMLAEEIRNCFLEKRKLSPLLHQQALQLYREYLVIGGMPEAVSIYAGERSLFDEIGRAHV